jgi:hypothetical protein
MNDVSVLLPLPHSETELAAMVGFSELIPRDLFTMAHVGITYDNLRAVAFRLDPCFGELGAIRNDTPCENQLRVVFQALDFDPSKGQTFAQDSAVHAFYRITRGQLLDAVRDITAARTDDSGDGDLGPLAPHPIVASEGLDGPFGRALAGIIAKYAGEGTLERMTAFVLDLPSNGAGSGPLEDWQFQSFTVDGSTLVPHAIPALPQEPSMMSLAASTGPLAAQLSPTTTSNDNVTLLADYMMASEATTAERERALSSALRVLNPHDHSPDTIDCASCHIADPAITLVGEQLGMSPVGNPDAFVPDAAIAPADLAHTTSPLGADNVLNVHAFSYRSGSPMINQRVINETAANLAYLTTQL